MIGLIIKSTGSSYWVHTDEGKDIECHVKGNMRIRGIRTTSPVAVGDYVSVEQQADGTSWITDIEPRKNYIIRRSTNLSKESHILACNLDQVALIVTIRHPETSTTFIDRFLATAEAYRVPAMLIFNKVDLLTEEEQNTLSELRSLYEALGYPTLAICACQLRDANGSESPAYHILSESLANKVTLLAGNSGVGKSTLLNAIFGEEKTRTGAISSAHDKGMHTTTFSEMYPLPDSSGWLIDTPGIKGFGAVKMEKEEVGHYFREIFQSARNCRYGNCLHTGEPGCAVEQDVVNGKIASSRFESYLSLLGDCEESKYR